MNKKPTSLKEGLKDKIPENLLSKVNRSFEVVGNIAICEIEDELIEYENLIAQTLLEINKHITTILKKDGFHGGVFRTQKMKVIGGIDTKIATYKENDVILKLNVEEIYFSTKLSTEREQLAKNLTNPSGNILVLFSGSGPYTFVITRKNPNVSRITSVEINPQGHKYALENLELNKNNLKKSELFKELFELTKEHKLPIYDKHIIKHLNSIKYQFYNLDANEFNISLNEIEDISSIEVQKIELNDFISSYNEINKLDEENILQFNLEELNTNQKKILSQILILNSNKFKYLINTNNKNYLFSTLHEKNYLFQLLRKIDSINEVIKYDEIYMPLPKDAELFLPVAFKNANENCVVHMYDFVHDNDFPHKSENAVKEYAKKNGFEVEIIKTRKVGQYSPRKFRVCCDFKIIK